MSPIRQYNPDHDMVLSSDNDSPSDRSVVDALDEAAITFVWDGMQALPAGRIGSQQDFTKGEIGSVTIRAHRSPVGYTGHLFDPETGWYHARFRSYIPQRGRWATRDPAGYVDGMNLYGYVKNTPLIDRDLLGLISHQERLKNIDAAMDRAGCDEGGFPIGAAGRFIAGTGAAGLESKTSRAVRKRATSLSRTEPKTTRIPPFESTKGTGGLRILRSGFRSSAGGITIVGTGLGAFETGRNIREGDYGKATINGTATGAGIGVAAAASAGAPLTVVAGAGAVIILGSEVARQSAENAKNRRIVSDPNMNGQCQLLRKAKTFYQCVARQEANGGCRDSCGTIQNPAQ